MRNRISDKRAGLRLSDVISALSYALDITEGQPRGHAARSCMIGMRIAGEIGLSDEQKSALFYALLLKDLGCSSTAPKVCYLFGADERAVKRRLKVVDWTSLWDSAKYIASEVAPGGSLWERALRFVAVARDGREGARELIHLRCERGATIARALQLPEDAAAAIRALDEHWDGSGYPDGLRRDQIPLLGRILGFAQTVEVFWQQGGLSAALDVACERRKTWFDPELVDALLATHRDEPFWASLAGDDPADRVGELEPVECTLPAGDATLDRVAEAFGMVVDAKSPWTHCHSKGVADVATGIVGVMGLPRRTIRNVWRAALLHDVGKLGVSNLILDKPGKLTPDELTIMRRHPQYTHEILSRVRGFEAFTELAASHHERLDGCGYHRGLSADALSPETRALVVADMYEALAAKRPYRQDLSQGEVMDILDRQSGTGICPDALAALKRFLAQSHFVPYQLAA